jgi:hypothetical protein
MVQFETSKNMSYHKSNTLWQTQSVLQDTDFLQRLTEYNCIPYLAHTVCRNTHILGDSLCLSTV